MRINLRSLTWLEHDTCRAAFVRDDTEDVSATFTLWRHDASGIVGASPSPDIFADWDGTATECRAVVEAVVSFCLAAQGEGTEELADPLANDL